MRKTGSDKALVVGGTGFIGAEIVRQLVGAGRRPSVLVHRRPPLNEIISHVDILNGSLPGFNWDGLTKGRFATVYHLARLSGRGRIGRLLAAHRGRMANMRLIRRLEKMDPQPLLVYVAGTLAYGSCGDRMITEQCPLNPASFAREYCIAEEPVVEAVLDRRIRGMILRAPWVLGNGSWMNRFYLEPLGKFGYVPIYGDGANWMSFIHVSDCARMIIHLAGAGKPGKIYNLVSGVCTRQKDFSASIGDIAGVPAVKYSAADVSRRYGRAVAEAFGFSLRVSTMQEGAMSGFNLLYPDLSSMLENIMSKDTYQQS